MARLRICVCTSYAALEEPRAPRHAVALARMNREYEVHFVDSIPFGQVPVSPPQFSGIANLHHSSHHYSTRKTGLVRVAADRLRHKIARGLAGALGAPLSGAVSARAIGLEKTLSREPADVYVGHNIDTLLPVYRAARKHRASLIFDSMEFHSDMGDGQSPAESDIIRRIEARALPACSLVIASSPELAGELARQYGLKKLLPLYNVPPRLENLPEKREKQFALYWRNAVISLGQRGLDDILRALPMLPRDIVLHLQGKLPADRGAQLTSRLAELGIAERVFVHPPFLPHQAVQAAVPYTLGLCLERRGVRNHDLTVSNKMFDYFMAGLAVVSSDMEALASVIRRSGAGRVFKSGDAVDLAAQIQLLYANPAMLAAMAASAREFALREGNQESEMLKLETAFLSMSGTRPFPQSRAEVVDRLTERTGME
jgi:glycogen(starch) synthase